MNSVQRVTAALTVLAASCAGVEKENRGTGTTEAEARAIDDRVLHDCEALVEKLGPGWTLAGYPKGAVVEASKHGALTWDYTGQCVEIGCRDSKKIAVFVTEEDGGNLGAKIVDLTGREHAALASLRGEEGWDGSISTFNSDWAGTLYEQKLYLFILAGEVDGEREVLTLGWCQACRPCPVPTGPSLE